MSKNWAWLNHQQKPQASEETNKNDKEGKVMSEKKERDEKNGMLRHTLAGQYVC